MINKTCCFIGHREINETEELKSNLLANIEKLIVDKKVDEFLFGSKSRFNDLCLNTVTKISAYKTSLCTSRISTYQRAI